MQALDGRLVLSPSDLNDYVECPHLTTLALALEAARGTRERPYAPDEHGDLLRRKGEEHEAAYLAELRRQGQPVADVVGADRLDFEGSARATVEAMRAGAEVIYQATFVRDGWRGRADFLERVEQPTALGGWGYEALDAKLARVEKPTYVLQLCFYTEAIEAIQQARVGAMHVLLGVGQRRTLRPADFDAYFRRVRAGFLAAIEQAALTEPYRVEHCGLCEFRTVCDERWQREDHLLLVAGIRHEQVTRLWAAGIGTLATLARAPATKVDHVAPHTLEALREQAGLQLHRRTTGQLTWRTLPVEPARGFERLPRPSAGDVVFDIEGDPFWEPARGLHFLFGLLRTTMGPGGIARSGRTTGRRSGRRWRRCSTSSTSGSPAIPTCTSTTTAPTSPRRSSSSWACTPPARTRSTRCCGARRSSTCTGLCARGCGRGCRATR